MYITLTKDDNYGYIELGSFEKNFEINLTIFIPVVLLYYTDKLGVKILVSEAESFRRGGIRTHNL